MHIIYQFSRTSGEGEFLVISEEPEAEVLEEFLTAGYQLDHTYTIHQDGTSLPCDRALRHSLS